MTEHDPAPQHSAEGLDEDTGPVPILAVVGRPNVGKSTLVNRIIGRREAVVEDVPGVTRDRVSYDANWNGRAFTVVDTGGWDPDARGLAERIAAQAEVAVTLADAVLFVVDATVVPVTTLGSRDPGGSSGSLPHRGAVIDMVFGEPYEVSAVPWPRTREQVEKQSLLLREHMLVQLGRARASTGRELPGPLPPTDVDPDPATGVTDEGAP